MSIEASSNATRQRNWPLIKGLGLFLLELIVIGVAFKHGIEFTCLSNWPVYACSGPSGVLISIYCICAALALFAFLFPTPFRQLFEQAGQQRWPIGINLAGLIIALIPITFMTEGSGTASLVPALLLWTIGMSGILLGLLLYLAPLTHWRHFARTELWRLLPLVIGGALAPAFSTLIRPIWQIDTIASWTFSAVAAVIKGFGYDVEIYPERRVIGADSFYIDIAPVCSGIEGIALVTIFVTLYLFLFRTELRFPRVLVLYPIGIAVSATLNIVRIVILLMIGLEGNPELAVGGFHSHAGWLMFTIVSMLIIIAANTVGWLRISSPRRPQSTTALLPPFFQDTSVSMILPFAIFMFSAMLAQVFVQTPGVVYPARVALMAGALFLFFPVYRKLESQLDPVAVGCGAAVGVMWVLIPVATPEGPPPYGALTGGLLILWYVARGFGTIVLVPVIEELFFRGYLEQKLRLKNTEAWMIGAAVITAVIFAALHGRWVEAFIASLVFSYICHRSGRVTDAILAHGVANAIVFAVAAITQRVHII